MSSPSNLISLTPPVGRRVDAGVMNLDADGGVLGFVRDSVTGPDCYMWLKLFATADEALADLRANGLLTAESETYLRQNLPTEEGRMSCVGTVLWSKAGVRTYDMYRGSREAND